MFFANTTGNLGIPDLQAFLDWVASGKGFLGTHSASDTYHEAPSYLAMLGGEFVTHGAIVEAEVRVSEPANSAVAHLAPTFRLSDEWYRFQLAGPGRTVLLKFDRNPPDGLGTAGEAVDLPLAWQKAHGSGRVFYTALGHRAGDLERCALPQAPARSDPLGHWTLKARDNSQRRTSNSASRAETDRYGEASRRARW